MLIEIPTSQRISQAAIRAIPGGLGSSELRGEFNISITGNGK
jgi:hypothetical protein